VLEDVPPGSIAVGVPAKVISRSSGIRHLPDEPSALSPARAAG
jgi:serine acetyltransferase